MAGWVSQRLIEHWTRAVVSRHIYLLLALLIAVATAVPTSTILLADELKGPPDGSTDQPAISLEEIVTAIETGAPIIHRTILGDDLSIALNRLVGPERSCSQSRLQIMNSLIKGNINIGELSAKDIVLQESEISPIDSANEPNSSLSVGISFDTSKVNGGIFFS